MGDEREILCEELGEARRALRASPDEYTAHLREREVARLVRAIDAIDSADPVVVAASRDLVTLDSYWHLTGLHRGFGAAFGSAPARPSSLARFAQTLAFPDVARKDGGR